LKTEKVGGIRTPLLQKIKETKGYGYFEITKMKLENQDTSAFWAYDIQILATKEEDV